MTVRSTFTLDQPTDATLLRLAAERGKSKSAIVREAILDYAARGDRLSEAERRRRLEALRHFHRTAPIRPRSEALAEIAEVRAARRASGLRRP